MTRAGDGRGVNDRQSARGRLAAARASLPAAEPLSPERARAVLDERARRLAQAGAEERRELERLEVIRFTLSGERYALETGYVREVVQLSSFTPVPGAPPLVVGVANLRGEILAIFDLRELLGVPGRTISDLFRVVVVGTERVEFGLLADAVDEVCWLRAEELREAPEGLAPREHVRGVTEDALILLDGASLLADSGLLIDQQER